MSSTNDIARLIEDVASPLREQVRTFEDRDASYRRMLRQNGFPCGERDEIDLDATLIPVLAELARLREGEWMPGPPPAGERCLCRFSEGEEIILRRLPNDKMVHDQTWPTVDTVWYADACQVESHWTGPMPPPEQR